MHMHLCIHMTKVISLSDDAYSALKLRKTEQDSFSDVVLKLTGKKQSILDLCGTWPAAEADAIKKVLAIDRKKFKTRTYVLP